MRIDVLRQLGIGKCFYFATFDAFWERCKKLIQEPKLTDGLYAQYGDENKMTIYTVDVQERVAHCIQINLSQDQLYLYNLIQQMY